MAKMLLNADLCCLCAEIGRISPGHAGGGPDDRPVLRAGPALVCGHHTAKMPLNVVFYCLLRDNVFHTPRYLLILPFVVPVQKGCGSSWNKLCWP
jgi:hypothetical protein